jgi:hypothetical protein
MRRQKAAADGYPLRLIGYPGERSVAFQVGKREKHGRESNDPPHAPRAPLTHEANEPASRSQRGVVQPDGNDEQFGREKDRQHKQPREQAKGPAGNQKCLCASGHSINCADCYIEKIRSTDRDKSTRTAWRVLL